MSARLSAISGHRRLRNVAAIVAVGIAAAAALPAVAQAHAILVGSDPPAGARLDSAPARIVLDFSEPYVQGSEHVAVRRADGTAIPLSAPSGGGAHVRQPLPLRLRGIFVIAWRVISDDGHLSAGEFAFSVGSEGALPSVTTSAASTPWSQVVASWLFFVGLAVAFGGLLSERLVWCSRGPHAPAGVGVAVSALSSVALLVLLAGTGANGSFGTGLHGAALRAAYWTRPGALTLGVFAALVVAALLLAVGRARALALVPLAAAAILTSVRGHAGTGGHWWAPVIDSIHLLAAAAWVGALVHAAVVLVRAPDRAAAGGLAIRRYSRLALPTVAVVLTSGILSAFAEFRSVHSAFNTGYGQTLVVKTALVLAALAVAAASRLLALPGGAGSKLPLLRGLTLSESTLVVAVLAAVGLLVNLAPPRTTAVPVAAQTGALGAPPLSGPVVRLAGFAGRTAVGLAASDEELRFTVMPPPGRATSDTALTADARRPDGKSAALTPRPCGTGCFSIRYSLRPGTTRVIAAVSSPGSSPASIRFDITGPISDARPELLARVAKVMRALPSVDVTEQLADGTRNLAGPTTYRLSGSGFVSDDGFSTGAAGVHVTGHADALTELTLAARDTNAWYRLWVDSAFRLRREEIVSAGLLARRTFAYPRAHAVTPARVVPRDVPTGPFVTALEDGDLAVGFAAQPAGTGRLTLTATVIGPDASGATAVRVDIALASAAETLEAAVMCAPGCYRVTLPYAGKPRTAVVRIRRLGHLTTALRFGFPAIWPPPSSVDIASVATRVFSRLRSVTIDEFLRSNPSYTAHTRWRLEAPDRLTYANVGGPQGVIIGNRRWDRDPGHDWIESRQLPVRQPIATWGTAPRQAALLGSGRSAGREVWRISFADPQVPAWYTAEIDKLTLRTLAVRMVAPAHFMAHTYGGFNDPPTIRPPR